MAIEGQRSAEPCPDSWSVGYALPTRQEHTKVVRCFKFSERKGHDFALPSLKYSDFVDFLLLPACQIVYHLLLTENESAWSPGVAETELG